MSEEITQKKNRGFRVMSAEKQREIASKGGKAAHAQGKAYKWTKELAVEAGRKGGQANAARVRGSLSGAVSIPTETEHASA